MTLGRSVINRSTEALRHDQGFVRPEAAIGPPERAL
jgi:hypothetical protein